jgi:hypothetical protein
VITAPQVPLVGYAAARNAILIQDRERAAWMIGCFLAQTSLPQRNTGLILSVGAKPRARSHAGMTPA